MKMNDLTGKIFDKLTVEGIDPENAKNSSGRILWKCKCECGAYCYKTADSLKKKNLKNPKACSIRCSTLIPLNEKFNKLTIIGYEIQEGKETRYKCKCDCGKEIIVYKYNLTSGNTKSCGCYQKEFMSKIGKMNSDKADLTNQRFGKLIALSPTEERINRSIIWKCQCDCGNFHYASVPNLKNGYVTRCKDCQIISKGEEEISLLLEKNNISFSKQKTFNNCRFLDSNAMAKFDFYVEDKYLIEFDGKQHFQSTSGWNTEEHLNKVKQRDNYKNQWCKDNNIPLIRIPYNLLGQITLEDLKIETTKYLI